LPEHQSVDDCRRSLLLPRLKQLVTLRREGYIRIYLLLLVPTPSLKRLSGLHLPRFEIRVFLLLHTMHTIYRKMYRMYEARTATSIVNVGTRKVTDTVWMVACWWQLVMAGIWDCAGGLCTVSRHNWSAARHTAPRWQHTTLAPRHNKTIAYTRPQWSSVCMWTLVITEVDLSVT